MSSYILCDQFFHITLTFHHTQKQSALEWLFSCIISQINSNRNALIKESYRKIYTSSSIQNSFHKHATNKLQQKQDLKKHKNKLFIVAGNGFILLA